MNRSEVRKKNYQICTRCTQRVLMSCGQTVTSTRAHEHSAAAATLRSTRATLDSSSTRTPLVAVLVRLRTARAALEGTSMISFPSVLHHRKKDTVSMMITRLLKRNEHETSTSTVWPSHGHTNTQQQQQQQRYHPAALEQHSTRAALVRRLLLLFYSCLLLEYDELDKTVLHATQYVVQISDKWSIAPR